MMRSCNTAIVFVAAALVLGATAGADAGDPVLKFVSAPDLINADVEEHAPRCYDMDETDPDYAARRQVILDARALAGLPQVPSHSGDTNGDGILSLQEGYRGGLQATYEAIGAEGADFLTVSGDMIDGSYGLGSGDVATRRAEAAAQADIYYGAYNQHLAEVGIGKIYTVIGDHELGDNNWDSKRLDVMPTYLAKYGEHLPMPSTNARGGYVDAPARYTADGRVWARQEGNTLMVGIETFDMDYDASGNITAIHASSPGEPDKRINIEQDQLDWLQTTLAAARTDASIDHVVVMGHMPVDDRSVRTSKTSNMRIADGADGAFWQTLADGGADLYLAGEVHAQSGFMKHGVTQIVGGGNFFATGETEYTVVEVFEDRIEMTLKGVDPVYNGNRSLAADPVNEDKSKPREWRVAAGEGFQVLGTMTIDTSGAEPRVVSATGKMRDTFYDYDAPTSRSARFDAGGGELQDGFVLLTGPFDGTNVQVSVTSDGDVDVASGYYNGHPDFELDGVQIEQLLEDALEAKTWEGSSYLDIVVSGLDEGEYTYTGYFHHNGGKAPSGASAIVTVDTDGSGFETGGQTLYTTGEHPDEIGIVQFTFEADGEHDVTFRIQNDLDGARILTNGFEITPEPATLTLLGLGGLGLALRGRSR